MISVAHVITGLAPHGAESMLYRLVSAMDRSRFRNTVISLTTRGEVGPLLEAEGIAVTALGMAPGSLDPFKAMKLALLLRSSRPDVVQTWMYHADLAGSFAAVLAGRPPVAWGVHHSNLDPAANKRMTILTARLCARISRFLPARIVCCSEASRRVHATIGYAAAKLDVVPNGFDVEAFAPDPAARKELRARLAIPEACLVLGVAARFHPHKDHANLIAAAARLHSLFPQLRFVLCGDHIAWDNDELAGPIRAAGLEKSCHLLGPRRDIAEIYPAFDIAVSPSRTEAFPLSVGEAMACGVPCVVTDVGDSALLVGDTGRVVPPGDPDALARACRELVLMGRENLTRLGLEARKRIERDFSLQSAVERYQSIYESLAARRPFQTGEPSYETRPRYRVAGGRDAA